MLPMYYLEYGQMLLRPTTKARRRNPKRFDTLEKMNYTYYWVRDFK